MPRKRRRRHSKVRDQAGGQGGYAYVAEVAEEDEPRFHAEPVPADYVPRRMMTDHSFQPAGIHCRRCRWTTSKKGFSGRQALRAHYKVHARDDRAGRGAVLLAVLVLLLIVVLTVFQVVKSLVWS